MLRTRRPSVTAVPTEFGQVLLDRRKGRYFHLNGTATTIADSLRGGVGIEDTAREISRRYEIDDATARTDVETVDAQLREAGLL
ncbi:lasso peptide biosynthesis PqqD family chaperone [Rhodococcus sp. BP-149]|uniref:lasso peptide biosynthesis PqqD family chaperone n=1 Tax=unclassified Rhodococcus (in: high G+C Gram-positive bacteria) TaxID=192944 RepID=UPI001C9A3500|nr:MULTISPECIES: lasso peptide biosynthesis PqqD family chaperone [unclassified Rhodococcus (in: high G+C Gram-positive bacteria)]MBY6687162.1 lasso peptide biosynthesis PqqD family chaperone [Rhodococcus sp. BP-288]MBY6694415.1 lasso peptide biosynthesis PqqD family chaperone [Rhodococcus sp. BP-188]MBY6698124.1 lasso peptide biosynthesis PqqD family chaperone [Rhodococcus sp. BP-285]MBY6704344.1 lasso peptide biosynthesis PqqD family chaperone [Rhodococcus sp. BP-283]MBY6706175.1 lasso pepti